MLGYLLEWVECQGCLLGKGKYQLYLGGLGKWWGTYWGGWSVRGCLLGSSMLGVLIRIVGVSEVLTVVEQMSRC